MKKLMWFFIVVIALLSLGAFLLVTKFLFSLPGLLLMSGAVVYFMSRKRKTSDSTEKEFQHG